MTKRSTPVEVGGVYRVQLESITLGGERLPIRSHMAVIDTGTVRLANGYFTTEIWKTTLERFWRSGFSLVTAV